MKKTRLFFLCGLIVLLANASATDNYIFKASAAITVKRVDESGATTDKIIAKTLKGDDLINLTLARPLGTNVDSATAVLALAVVVEGPGAVAAPKSQLIIYNPDPLVVGAAKVTTIATLSNLDFDVADLGDTKTGQGISEVKIAETTTGVDPTNNKFFAATLNGSGQATVPDPAVAVIDAFTFTLKSLGGQLHIMYKLAKKPADPAINFDGTVMKGMLKTKGAPIAVVDIP